MGRRSPSYSPPRSRSRGYGGRGRSPERGRYNRRKEAPCGLLVRNIPKDSRPEEVRTPFERFGRVRDVYLPKDYYTGEARGFGFVQFLDAVDAAEAKRHMDHQIFRGREITVVFAEENRKRPEQMRAKARPRSGRVTYGGHRRSPYSGRSPSRSPRCRSSSPRGRRYSRSASRSSESGYSRSPRRYSRSPCQYSKSPRRYSRSRSRSLRESSSPSAVSPSPRRRHSPSPSLSNSRKRSSPTPEARSSPADNSQ